MTVEPKDMCTGSSVRAHLHAAQPTQGRLQLKKHKIFRWEAVTGKLTNAKRQWVVHHCSTLSVEHLHTKEGKRCSSTWHTGGHQYTHTTPCNN